MNALHKLWDRPLIQRLGMLKTGTLRIAYVAAKPDLGTFRYRAFNPVECLNNSSEDITASYFFLSDLDRIDDLSDYADVLVAVRLPYDGRVDRLFRKFSNRGKKIYFDIDDLIIDGRYDTLVAANLGYRLEGEDLYWWSAFIANWKKALSFADEVITTNPHLAAAIAEISPHPVHVVPNTLNQHQLDVPISPKASVAGGLRIGYFSGSKSHDHDFEVARQALITHLEASPSSRLTVVGHLESLTGFYSVQSQVTRLPFMDFLDLQDALGSVDLNIVPLQNSAFTDAKSELKYFEAAVAGTPTLASNTAVFGSVIADGANGFLARPSEWGAKLDMISGMTSRQRTTVADAARSHALANYSPEALLRHLKRVFVAGA
jgi:glycosyltransferase involved in cell wall biosynthesis